MRGHFSILLFLIALPAFADRPKIPRTNDVVRYERVLWPSYQIKEMSRERGDVLLGLLREVKHWKRDVDTNVPPGMVVDPAPPRLEMGIVLTNGSKWEIGLDDGCMVFPRMQKAVGIAPVIMTCLKKNVGRLTK
jgi:hypothetical protein